MRYATTLVTDRVISEQNGRHGRTALMPGLRASS